MKQDVYNTKNEVVGTVDLPEPIFNASFTDALVKQVLLAQLANRRKPWAHAKDRSEVRGGGRKPWRQKGTGRARHGSIRSPLWSGGGKAHGPTKERDYSQKVNKKMKRAALFGLLSKKRAQGEVKVFDALAIEAPKTKNLFTLLSQISNIPKKEKKFNTLIIPAPENQNITRASHNLVKTKVARPQSLNVYDLLNHKHVYIEQDAVAAIAAHYLENHDDAAANAKPAAAPKSKSKAGKKKK